MAHSIPAGPSGSGLPDPPPFHPPLSPGAGGGAAPPGPPPPTYVPTQPQILVVPLPEALSFFWARTIQGEVYVKGLGEDRTHAVKSLTVTAHLTDRVGGMPDIDLGSFPTQALYPPSAGDASTSVPASSPTPFPTSHRFALDLPRGLPNGSPLPGSLDLGQDNAVRWTLEVRLTLSTGEVVTELVRIEGVPPDLPVSQEEECEEAVARLDRAGVSVRLVLACTRPRLGDSLHIGVEVCPQRRERTGLAGLVAQPDPNDILRPLRRVRVELVRIVDVASPPQSSSAAGDVNTVTTVLHASGKSLRYPGSVGRHPPLRVLFALPTAQLHPGMLATGGEISASTPYHNVRFMARATLGFGVSHDTTQPPGAGQAPGSPDGEQRGWTVEQEITVRPPLWREPAPAPERATSEETGEVGAVGADDILMPPPEDDSAAAREAYRRKGRDVVGASGTVRAAENSTDGPPPPFDYGSDAGPSGTHSNADNADMDTDTDTDTEESMGTAGSGQAAGLPTFNESEAQMRSRTAPMFDDGEPPRPARRPSLHGELATWTEYDGYERFSLAPPPAAASFGVQGIMDPPREGEDAPDAAVAGDIAARLGLGLGAAPTDPAALMEQLGLGHGRVVDLQDDLPPGIDEPSLPALPGFGNGGVAAGLGIGVGVGGGVSGAPGNANAAQPPRFMDPFAAPAAEDGAHAGHGHELDHPPSFDASEAAEAVGGVARSRVGSVRLHAGLAPLPNMGDMDMEMGGMGGMGVPGPGAEVEGDAPPGYFGGGPPAYGS